MEDKELEDLLKEYGDVVHSLPAALSRATSARLDPQMKRRVMQALEKAQRDASVTRPGHDSPVPDGKRGEARWKFPLRLQMRTIVAFAAVILVAVLIALTAQLSIALAQERALRAEFANLVGQQELVLDVIDSNRTVKFALRATTSGSPSYGKMYTRPDMQDVVVMAARLNPPPQAQAYHLWLTSQGKTILAGVMKVNAQGFGLLVYQSDRNGPTFESARLTLQVEGSTVPSESSVLMWEAGR